MRFFSHSRSIGTSLLLLQASLWCFITASPAVQARGNAGEENRTSPATTSPLEGFKGRALVVLSDGDQSATAYADGVLDRPDGVSDTLTVISSVSADCHTKSVSVSNSVLGWPQALAVAPDGKHAYIVETRSAPKTGKVKDVLKALPDGHLLTTVDLGDIRAPKIIDQRPIAVNPWTIDISPDGKTLAVDTRQKDANLLLIDLVDNVPGAVTKVSVKDHLGREVPVNSVRWSPVGKLLALTLGDKELAFMDVTRFVAGAIGDDAIVARIPKVGKQITPGKFSPDGRFYMMTDLNCGKSPQDYLFNGKGLFVVVTTPSIVNEKPHKILSTASGITPEGFALSPDGTILASVNMAHCFLPRTPLFKIVPAQEKASITVSKFDPVKLTLTKAREFDFEGLLPRHITFDDSGQYLVVTVYQNKGSSDQGSLQFFQVIKDPRPGVEACRFQLKLPRGAHTVDVLH
jgi:DNA-binding beta-propeller fold protein YncE